MLERHKCPGFLQIKSKPDRIAAFVDKDRADRQLLVALHELTLDCVALFDEIDRKAPDNFRPPVSKVR